MRAFRSSLPSCLLLALLQWQSVVSFTTSQFNGNALRPNFGTTTTTTSMQATRARPTSPKRIDLSSKFKNFMAPLSSAQDKSPQELFLKQVERKEQALLRRREEAQARLVAYEESIKKLQDKKAEYLVASPDEPPAFTETALRSAVKAFLWRVIAGSITFISTLKFSGSVMVALKVVSADFFSKAFTMFLGERIMNKSQAGRKSGSDAIGRSFAKALIWRLFAIANTLTMAVFVAKDLSMASKIASTDAVFKTILMVFYERVWARVQWGKEYLMEWSI